MTTWRVYGSWFIPHIHTHSRRTQPFVYQIRVQGSARRPPSLAGIDDEIAKVVVVVLRVEARDLAARSLHAVTVLVGFGLACAAVRILRPGDLFPLSRPFMISLVQRKYGQCTRRAGTYPLRSGVGIFGKGTTSFSSSCTPWLLTIFVEHHLSKRTAFNPVIVLGHALANPQSPP